MELKDVILSTLAELDSDILVDDELSESNGSSDRANENIFRADEFAENEETSSNNEQLWLENVRERLLVLFEGFQSPNNVQIEAKIDLSLNFLEYLLANIDTRLDTIKGKKD
jgi:hypothetical protein